MPVQPIDVTMMRGGTSKGVYVRLRDLPPAGQDRDALVLSLLGSPDPMQIDGLGGTHSSTSKVMGVGTAQEAREAGFDVVTDDVDLAYVFAQGAIDKPMVNWTANCGNLTAAVAPYGILQGLVSTTDPMTRVRLLNLNTNVVIEADVPTEDGQPSIDGDFVVPGVPGTGARIDVRFLNPAGGSSGTPVLPTGQRSEKLALSTGEVEVSFVHVNNPVVFVAAESMGLRGSELSTEINADPALLARIEELRRATAVRLGMASSMETAAEEAPHLPLVILVSAPHDHAVVGGAQVKAQDCDLIARMTSLGVVHHAFPGTGLTVVAVAARLPGTVAHALTAGSGDVRLAHPKGLVTVRAEIEDDGSPDVVVSSVSIPRTARPLITGVAYPRTRAAAG